jgi:hypothetical protein
MAIVLGGSGFGSWKKPIIVPEDDNEPWIFPEGYEGYAIKPGAPKQAPKQAKPKRKVKPTRTERTKHGEKPTKPYAHRRPDPTLADVVTLLQSIDRSLALLLAAQKKCSSGATCSKGGRQ